MLHSGYHVEDDPNGELRFYRAGGTYIGSPYPARDRTLPSCDDRRPALFDRVPQLQ